MSREAMQLALDALTNNCRWAYRYPAIEALKAELAKPESDPVVWMQSTHLDKFEQHACDADSMFARCSHRQLQSDYVPLYRKEDV